MMRGQESPVPAMVGMNSNPSSLVIVLRGISMYNSLGMVNTAWVIGQIRHHSRVPLGAFATETCLFIGVAGTYLPLPLCAFLGR